MTQRNIYVMDVIVSKIAEGASFSKATKLVYNKRSVCIPYNEGYFEAPLVDLGMTSRSTNALLRARLRTLGDVIEFCVDKKITEITNLGKSSGVEVFETILDYAWDRMTEKEKELFLIDTVERNSGNIRSEIA